MVSTRESPLSCAPSVSQKVRGVALPNQLNNCDFVSWQTQCLNHWTKSGSHGAALGKPLQVQVNFTYVKIRGHVSNNFFWGCRKIVRVYSFPLAKLEWTDWLVTYLVGTLSPVSQKDYIKVENKLHSISKLFISQVVIPQVMFFLACLYSTGTQHIQQDDLFYSAGLHRNQC